MLRHLLETAFDNRMGVIIMHRHVVDNSLNFIVEAIFSCRSIL